MFSQLFRFFEHFLVLLGSSPKAPPRGVYSLHNYVNERESNLSMNSTFNPDEISINETLEEEEAEEKEEERDKDEGREKEEQEEKQNPRLPMR
jgi:hypothetical protein